MSSPSLSESNTANLRSSNPKSSANISRGTGRHRSANTSRFHFDSGRIKYANFCNLICGKFSHAVSFSACHSLFGNSILRIVLRSAKKEMIRVDASGVITLMANSNSFRDWAKCNFPLKTARNINESTSNTKGSIAIAFARFPFPTSLRFYIFGFKPCDIFRGNHVFKYTLIWGAE